MTTQAYHRAVSRRARAARHHVSPVDGARLARLEGELSQTELAAKMMVEPPTLVGILDRMERDGWISAAQLPVATAARN